MTFHIQLINLGSSGDPFSCIRVWKNNDPRWVDFTGDAYWMWADTPSRANGKGYCWAQALHDSLEGFHSTILHSGHDRFVVHKNHSDYMRVLDLWNRVNQ